MGEVNKVTRTFYVTEDGKEHTSEYDARKYSEVLDFRKFVDSELGYISDQLFFTMDEWEEMHDKFYSYFENR